MGILARLVDGVNAADIGVLLALVWLVVRLEWTRSENTIAHDGITRNIDGVKRDLTEKIDGVKRDLTEKIDGAKRDLTEKIDGAKRDHTRDIDGVKQDLDDVKQDVKKLLTGDVAWMQAVLQERQRGE